MPVLKRSLASPKKWFFTGKDFDLVFEEWKVPSAASPDVYSDKIPIIPYFGERKVFWLITFARQIDGIFTLFGCNLGKLHCREYISACCLSLWSLGQQYNLSIWVPHGEGVKSMVYRWRFDREVNRPLMTGYWISNHYMTSSISICSKREIGA